MPGPPPGGPGERMRGVSELASEKVFARKGAGSDAARVGKQGRFARMMHRPELGALSGAILVYAVFYILASDSGMFSLSGLVNIFQVSAETGVLAVAAALLMIAGEFDLSIGSIVGFAGMTIMVLVTAQSGGGFGWSFWPAVAVALVLSLLIGAFNGALVMSTKLPSFIITLGSLFIFRGLTIALTRSLTNRTQLGDLDQVVGYESARPILAGQLTFSGARFSITILWWILLTILATWVLLRTRQGNWIFGAGGDANAARNVGVPVTRLKVALFMTTALAAFLVGLLQVVQFTGADTLRGTQLEFRAIIAAVVGGNLLTGGYGSAVGASLGALTFAMIDQGIRLTGVDADWFQVVLGAVLVAAVLFNNWIRGRAAKR
jgi:simple sugar transport system permease protein